jgi:hypothetical protein
MDAECFYCDARVTVNRLSRHVRLTADDDHSPHGTVPDSDVDSPWNLRVNVSAADREGDPDGSPTANASNAGSERAAARRANSE